MLQNFTTIKSFNLTNLQEQQRTLRNLKTFHSVLKYDQRYGKKKSYKSHNKRNVGGGCRVVQCHISDLNGRYGYSESSADFSDTTTVQQNDTSAKDQTEDILNSNEFPSDDDNSDKGDAADNENDNCKNESDNEGDENIHSDEEDKSGFTRNSEELTRYLQPSQNKSLFKKNLGEQQNHEDALTEDKLPSPCEAGPSQLANPSCDYHFPTYLESLTYSPEEILNSLSSEEHHFIQKSLLYLEPTQDEDSLIQRPSEVYSTTSIPIVNQMFRGQSICVQPKKDRILSDASNRQIEDDEVKNVSSLKLESKKTILPSLNVEGLIESNVLKNKLFSAEDDLLGNFQTNFNPPLLTVNAGFVEYSSDPWSLALSDIVARKTKSDKTNQIQIKDILSGTTEVDHSAAQGSLSSPELSSSTTMEDGHANIDSEEQITTGSTNTSNSGELNASHILEVKRSLMWNENTTFTSLEDLNVSQNVREKSFQNKKGVIQGYAELATPELDDLVKIEKQVQFGSRLSLAEIASETISQKKPKVRDSSIRLDGNEKDLRKPSFHEEGKRQTITFAGGRKVSQLGSYSKASEFPQNEGTSSSARPKSSRMFTMNVRSIPYSPPKPSWYKAAYEPPTEKSLHTITSADNSSKSNPPSKSAGGMPVSSIYLSLDKDFELKKKKKVKTGVGETGVGEQKDKSHVVTKVPKENAVPEPLSWKEMYTERVHQNFAGCFDDIDDFIQEFNAKTVSIVENAAAAAAAAVTAASVEYEKNHSSHWSQPSTGKSIATMISGDIPFINDKSQSGQHESVTGGIDEHEKRDFLEEENLTHSRPSTSRSKSISKAEKLSNLECAIDELTQNIDVHANSKVLQQHSGKEEAKVGRNGAKFKNIFQAVRVRVRRHFSHGVEV